MFRYCGSASVLAIRFLSRMKCSPYLSGVPLKSISSGFSWFLVMYVCSLVVSDAGILSAGLALQPFALRGVIVFWSWCMSLVLRPLFPTISHGRSPVLYEMSSFRLSVVCAALIMVSILAFVGGCIAIGCFM